MILHIVFGHMRNLKHRKITIAEYYFVLDVLYYTHKDNIKTNTKRV